MYITSEDFVATDYMPCSENEIDCELIFQHGFDVKEFFDIPDDEWDENKNHRYYGSVLINTAKGFVKVECELNNGCVYCHEYRFGTDEYYIFYDLITANIHMESHEFDSIEDVLDSFRETEESEYLSVK